MLTGISPRTSQLNTEHQSDKEFVREKYVLEKKLNTPVTQDERKPKKHFRRKQLLLKTKNNSNKNSGALWRLKFFDKPEKTKKESFRQNFENFLLSKETNEFRNQFRKTNAHFDEFERSNLVFSFRDKGCNRKKKEFFEDIKVSSESQKDSCRSSHPEQKETLKCLPEGLSVHMCAFFFIFFSENKKKSAKIAFVL
jgi:hypothetical protein